MFQLPSSERISGPAARRFATLALVGLLLMSTVGGVVGSSAIAAAQQAGPGSGNTTNATTGSGGNATTAGNTTTAGNATASGGGTNNSTAANPVKATIQGFKQAKLGYAGLPTNKKQQIKNILRKLNKGGLSDTKKNQLIAKVQKILSSGPLMTPREYRKPKQIIKKHLNSETTLTTDGDPTDGPLISEIKDLASLVDGKMKSIANSFVEGAASLLTNVYNFAFNTPVPQNSGWHGILGEPTNKPFQNLYQNLLVEKLYPLTNYLLSIGVLVLGLSLAVNPLLSRFRALNLIIKFVSFLMLYVFAWAAVTFMHGIVNDITMWIRPSPKAMEQLVTNVGKMSAAGGATAVGAYFAGASGMLATGMGLALELGMRNVLLQYFFPYVFAPLVFILYVSPWQRLRSFASVALWQYANVLTLVIPMALFLKAATLIKFNPGETLKGMILLIGLFFAALCIPGISTYAFLQMPGKAVGGVKSAAAGAASRVDAAKDKLGWGDDEAASDSTATGDTSPGDRTEDAVDASSESQADVPSSGELSDESVENMDPTGSSDTTAEQVRALDEEQHSDPMNPDAMKQAYFEDEDRSGPHRTTMQHKLAD